MGKILLNTYRPLIFTKFGSQASIKFNIPPYVDGSCRREPDFESEFPSITALCRGRACAPRLFEGDRIIYLTVKSDYDNIGEAHYRLTAILKIHKRFENHQDAANWYIKNKILIPSNCLIDGNPPLSIEKTAGLKSTQMKRIMNHDESTRNKQLSKMLKEWDAEYWDKTKRYPVFITCKKIFIELNNPPILLTKDLTKIFKKVPVTRTPPEITKNDYKKILTLIKKYKNR
ncbi:MAG: hypothetical protein D8M52_10690 [Chlorobi bacterium]|jgi:hypothetical protein|nr:hypothetical protein [Ignavibacteriota bacterium]MBL1162164.1 hypothetical protein [Chlorobiota bacterium]MCO6447167.1 hypothetical protein [Ignavibacterium album]NOG68626.1 hypothetical protein [Chlorobiota bacterium]HOJ07233.1 hypothetical protein [Ignavibacteriaceae bacterium]